MSAGYSHYGLDIKLYIIQIAEIAIVYRWKLFNTLYSHYNLFTIRQCELIRKCGVRYVMADYIARDRRVSHSFSPNVTCIHSKNLTLTPCSLRRTEQKKHRRLWRAAILFHMTPRRDRNEMIGEITGLSCCLFCWRL